MVLLSEQPVPGHQRTDAAGIDSSVDVLMDAVSPDTGAQILLCSWRSTWTEEVSPSQEWALSGVL